MEEPSFPLKKSALGLESQNGAQMIRYTVTVKALWPIPYRGALTTGHASEGPPAITLLSHAV